MPARTAPVDFSDILLSSVYIVTSISSVLNTSLHTLNMNTTRNSAVVSLPQYTGPVSTWIRTTAEFHYSPSDICVRSCSSVNKCTVAHHLAYKYAEAATPSPEKSCPSFIQILISPLPRTPFHGPKQSRCVRSIGGSTRTWFLACFEDMDGRGNLKVSLL